MAYMGNIHVERDVIDIINPPGNPFLHIVPRAFIGGRPSSYRFIDSLSGLVLMGGTADLTSGVRDFVPRVRIELPFLPTEVELEQARPIDGKKVVEEIILRNAPEIVRVATPPINVLASSHGSMWGLYPEELIRKVLAEYGFRPQTGSFPEIEGWGRKRIKVHAIALFSLN